MGDVFPRRNLGLSEYWGRTIERRIEGVEKTNQSGALFLEGVNRANSSAAVELSRNLLTLQDQLEKTQALVDSLPATGSDASYSAGFGLSPGWQTVTSLSLTAPVNKNRINALATGVCRVVDPGSGGGSTPDGFRWPFPTSTVTSEYGPRDGRMHEGIDFGVPEGTPIPASNAGTVTGNGFGSGTGWYVDITHPGNIRTRYFHMVAQSDVAIGTVVSKSQVIGFVGNTGNSFGAHLHWETIVNGVHMNPRDFMAQYGGEGSDIPKTFGRPRARLIINGNVSREFFPHRNFTGPSTAQVTLNQIFPQQGVDNVNGVSANVEFQIYAEADVPSNSGNFARLTTFGVFQP